MIAAWFSPAELAELALPEMPAAKSKVLQLARRERWHRPEWQGRFWRERRGAGGGLEFHASVLPAAAQVKLALLAGEAGAVAAPHVPASWAGFDRLPAARQAQARLRLEWLDAIDALVRAGSDLTVATRAVAEQAGVAMSTLYRWREAVTGLGRGDWLPALAPRHGGRPAECACPDEAWEALKADYLRPEQPNFTDCYRRLESMAGLRGWRLPSRATLERRMAAMPVEVRMLKREGVEALKRMFPAQIRTRGHFHALEAVNADGHKWDVFVRWPDGSVGRPMMCAFQDLYSGMLLSWRVDKTANKEAVRLAFGDLVEEYGIPSLCWLDNGRDFASKWITGGTPNRYRFKTLDEEPSGVMTLMGVEVHWTTPYSGQSKPIERAFRDMAQGIAKHPRFAGAYCGNSPEAKPENYGKAAVPLDVFLATLAEGIAEHNARLGRRSRVCGGVQSFAGAFAASYGASGTVIRRASAEQRRLWLLAAEMVRVDRVNGSIVMDGNRFWAPFLTPLRGQRVTVRFDPQALQAPLHVYRADGGYLGEAACTEAAGFNDVGAAAEHARRRKAWMRAARDLAAAEISMPIEQLAAMLPAVSPGPKPEAKVVRPFVPAFVAAGRSAAAVAVQPDDDDDDLDWLAAANATRRRAELRLVQPDDASDGPG